MNQPTINPNLSLKPCPFCGKEAKMRIFAAHSIGVTIECPNKACGGQSDTFYTNNPPGEWGVTLSKLLETYEKAVDQWNTRA